MGVPAISFDLERNDASTGSALGRRRVATPEPAKAGTAASAPATRQARPRNSGSWPPSNSMTYPYYREKAGPILRLVEEPPPRPTGPHRIIAKLHRSRDHRKNKADQQKPEAETGGGMDLIQFMPKPTPTSISKSTWGLFQIAERENGRVGVERRGVSRSSMPLQRALGTKRALAPSLTQGQGARTRRATQWPR